MTNCPRCGGYQALKGDTWTCPKCQHELSGGVIPDFEAEARAWLLQHEGHIAIGREKALAEFLQDFYQRGIAHGA